jgi:hypothetical protein
MIFKTPAQESRLQTNQIRAILVNGGQKVRHRADVGDGDSRSGSLGQARGSAQRPPGGS